ncbi:TPA: hypothetical protein QDB26_004771 [Burkholderia vietnamiensis]|nr:hypothetical protein [Burkholderia pseudomultivorans]HDR8925979.1 hypothetical protein [Burkholderia vietnamiensis]HDR9215988.1 hypothetical protein [Burkholderia vietnamiensis]
MFPPVSSPIDTLIAFAIVFVAAVLSTTALLAYVDRLKAKAASPVCAV